MRQNLRLTTLGEFTIRLDGDPVTDLASRKAEALLVYLAVTQRIHAREHLATLLWDDRPLGRSLANLSVVISSLKQTLGGHLVIERSSLGMAVGDGLWVDVLELESLLSEPPVSSPLENSPATKNLKAAEAALTLYRGEFMQGFHIREARGFEEWLSLERERIQRKVLNGYRWLADAFARNGRTDRAVKAQINSLEIDPLQEAVHRSLMRSLALTGREVEALSQYRACSEVLDHELGVEPALETRQLFDRILARRERQSDNLPSTATEIIGRRAEIAEIRSSLLDPETRMLSLIGPGGIGKTRLALEVARRLKSGFLEGVWFVDLAPLEDPALVPQAVARAVGMPDRAAVDAQGNGSDGVTVQILEFLYDQELLILLDNCEHLLESCVPFCDRMIRSCPGIKLLVTSRERFDLPAERLYSVEPLEIPPESLAEQEDLAELGEIEAIRLFLERAQAVRSGFGLTPENAEVIASICQTLDGMPLALELAASRLGSYSLAELKPHLEDSLSSLGRKRAGVDPRHQTLRAAIEWSYQLLEPEEQRLFRLTTIYRGGFNQRALVNLMDELQLSINAVEQLLSALVEKSLLIHGETRSGRSRYSFLEPIRQFGQVKMTEDPLLESALDAHADHYLRLAEELGPQLHGRARKETLELLVPEADNLRAALGYQLSLERPEECLRFANALWEGYWLNQGAFNEGRDWINRVLAISDETMGYRYGSAILARGAFAWTLGQVDDAARYVDQALEFADQIGNLKLLQWAHYWKAIVIFDQSEFDEAYKLVAKGALIADRAGQPRGKAWCIFYQAQIARVRGHLNEATRLYKESLQSFQELDVFGAGWCYIYLAHLATEQRDYHLAREYLARSLEIYEELENVRGLGGTARGLGLVELEEGNLELAEAHLRRSRTLFDQLGWIKMASSSEIHLGFILAATGRPEEASQVLLKSLAFQEREKDLHAIAMVLSVMGLLALKRGFAPAAGTLLLAGRRLQTDLGIMFPAHLEAAIAENWYGEGGEYSETPIPDLAWEDCVRRILATPEKWPEALLRTE